MPIDKVSSERAPVQPVRKEPVERKAAETRAAEEKPAPVEEPQEEKVETKERLDVEA